MIDDDDFDVKCCECNGVRKRSEFEWTTDNYGIPWKKVCWLCYEKVQSEIQKWTFDSAAAGESLEEDGDWI